MDKIKLTLRVLFLVICWNQCLTQNVKLCTDCSSNAVCEAKTNYFTCSCKSGFIGNGVNCTEKVYCSSFPCCPSGYNWDTVSMVCSDINECLDPFNMCYPGTCTNKIGSYLCGSTVGKTCGGIYCPYDQDCLNFNGIPTCADPCKYSKELNGANRLFTISSTGKFPTDQFNIGWFHFTLGFKMKEGCVGPLKCGSAEPFSLTSHPKKEDGVKMVPLTLNIATGCINGSSIPVKACDGFYVYKFLGTTRPEVYCSDISPATTTSTTATTMPTTTPTTTTTTTMPTTTTTPTTTTPTTTTTTTPTTTTTTAPTTTTPTTTITTTMSTTSTTIPTTTTTTTVPTTTTRTAMPTTTIPTTTTKTTMPTTTTTTTMPTTITTTTMPTTSITIPATTTTSSSPTTTTLHISPATQSVITPITSLAQPSASLPSFSSATITTPIKSTELNIPNTGNPPPATLNSSTTCTNVTTQSHNLNSSTTTQSPNTSCANISSQPITIPKSYPYPEENITVTHVSSRSTLTVRIVTQKIGDIDTKGLEINETTIVNIEVKTITSNNIYTKVTTSVSPTSILIHVAGSAPESSTDRPDTIVTSSESTTTNTEIFQPDSYCSQPAQTKTTTETSSTAGNRCSSVVSATTTTTITTTEEIIVLGPRGFSASCTHY